MTDRETLVLRGRHKLNFVPLIFSDPDRIVRIDSSERVELNGRGGGRMSNKRKSKKHASTPRRREVLLSKISIYIVYMFVSCHRYVNLYTSGKSPRTSRIFFFSKAFLKWRLGMVPGNFPEFFISVGSREFFSISGKIREIFMYCDWNIPRFHSILEILFRA